MNYRLKIKEIRIKKGIKQRDLADEIGIKKSTLSELENNKYEIKLSTLIKISDVLEVDVKDLYEKIE